MWTTHDVSEPGPWGVNIGHGLGVGDVNSDGRSDFLNAYGWWETADGGQRFIFFNQYTKGAR